MLMIIAIVPFCSAQKANYKFDTQNCTGFFHPAKEVIVLDKRNDTTAALGRIRSGMLNLEKNLKTGNPLSVSLSNYYTTLSAGRTAEIQQLVVVVYTFLAYEGIPDYSYRNAHFKYAADYFISAGDLHYRHLGYIDTVISVEGMEVSKKIMAAIDQSLCSLYESMFLAPLSESLYTEEDIPGIEKKRKETLPAYKQMDTANGVYYNWNDFKLLNKAAGESIVKKSNVYRIKYFNENGKARMKPASKAEIISFGGKVYYNVEDVFYPIYKKENDFYVVGYTSMNGAKSGMAVASGVMFGLVGGLIFGAVVGQASSEAIEAYEFKIDYKDGSLIPVRALTKKDLRSHKLR